MASRSKYHEIRGLGWNSPLLHATVGFNRRYHPDGGRTTTRLTTAQVEPRRGHPARHGLAVTPWAPPAEFGPPLGPDVPGRHDRRRVPGWGSRGRTDDT